MACSDSICMRVYWYVHCLFKQISIDRRIFWDIGMLYFQLKVNYNINKYLICQLIKLRIESIVSSLNQLKNHSHSIYIGNQFNAPMILNRIFLFGGRQKSPFRFFFIYLAKLVSIKIIYPSALYLVLARFTWLKLPYEQNYMYIYSNEMIHHLRCRRRPLPDEWRQMHRRKVLMWKWKDGLHMRNSFV